MTRRLDYHVSGLDKWIGQRIRELRHESGQTQEECAARLDMSRPTLSNIETGTYSITLHGLCSFARAFEVEPRTMLPKEKDLSDA